MRVALIARATLYTATGGDTFQIINTAKLLEKLSVATDIKLTDDFIDYNCYDLFHFFNITRPADILYHIQQTDRPFILSPILINYSEYDKYHRKGISGLIFRMLPGNAVEYLKTIARWVKGKDKLVSRSYLWKGHRRSVQEILDKASCILPNSQLEYEQLLQQYRVNVKYRTVPNGINTALFRNNGQPKDKHLVLCVARIEGIKNQLNLIKALNNTSYRLILIGAPTPNQPEYYEKCRQTAADNITFIDHLPQEELVSYYQKAAVHVLPSWFETCGLASLEAAAMGCVPVITDRGYAREYFDNMAVYCDPADPASILNAVEKAAACEPDSQLQNTIINNYTWQQAAAQTAAAYQEILQNT